MVSSRAEEGRAGDPYRELRNRAHGAPVVASLDPAAGLGSGAMVLGYEEASHVLRDFRTFSSANHAQMDEFRGVTIRQMDGEVHRRHRALVADAFRPSVIERWERDVVRPVIERLIAAIAPQGRAELVSEVTAPYPIQVICAILGLPAEEHAEFIRWSEGIVQGATDTEAGMEAKERLGAWLRPHVEARRSNPRGDLLSELVSAEIDGERLDDDHLYGFLRLLIPAGAETTFRAMGNVLFALLMHARALDAARADSELIPAMIEETLRWDTSVPLTVRTTSEPTELGGCPIAAGTVVYVALGAADRDESRWPDPDTWDPDRAPQPHLAFGTGPHQCLGVHLARMELRVGVQAVLERLPNLRIDPDEPSPAIEGQAFRGPERLPVLFDRSHP